MLSVSDPGNHRGMKNSGKEGAADTLQHIAHEKFFVISSKIISDQQATMIRVMYFSSVCRQSFHICETSPETELSIEGKPAVYFFGKNMLKAMGLTWLTVYKSFAAPIASNNTWEQ